MGEKINPELELAISSDAYSPGSSLYLGYDREKDEWSLIIRYSGDIKDLEEDVLNECVYLLGGFAVIKIYTYNIYSLQLDPRILYIDKASYYSYGAYETIPAGTNAYAKYKSCITEKSLYLSSLYGDGVCIGVIDSGLDIRNEEFCRDGNTRLLAYWNQNQIYTEEHNNSYKMGRIYDRKELSVLLEQGKNTGDVINTHGAEVTSIAAGSNLGVASCADIVMVEQKREGNFPDTISIMYGIDYLVRLSIDSNVPMVINISYGNNYGAHDGSSVLELFIDTVSRMTKVNVVTGTGNDGNKRLHAGGLLGNVSFDDLNIDVSGGVRNFGVQIWKNYIDNFDVLVYSPSYDLVLYLAEGQQPAEGRFGSTQIFGIYQSPSPYNIQQLIYIFINSEIQIETGVWKIRIMPKSIVNGVYNAYLPGDNYITGRVGFESANAFGSLTIPSTSRSAISVAAYDQRAGTFAGFSGRGFTTDNRVKPDIAAPGVEITAAAGDGNLVTADGTSISAAFVSGAAALLMEWGIVRGNDSFMYGEKLKAQLIKGAQQIETIKMYPNRYVGWGTICVDKSFESL